MLLLLGGSARRSREGIIFTCWRMIKATRKNCARKGCFIIKVALGTVGKIKM